MINVASLELCRELYELSGWEDGYESTMDWHQPVDGSRGAPAYDLGYLLRKLPLGELRNRDGLYSAWQNNSANVAPQYAETPEDAACKLAIELFKQGVLTK